MQTVQLKREIGDVGAALELCEKALKTQFVAFYKLWLIKAQLLEEVGQVEEARMVYDKAL